MEGFFLLLEWLLHHRPEKAIIDFQKSSQIDPEREYVIDSSYIAFRLTEILDGSGFPPQSLYRCRTIYGMEPDLSIDRQWQYWKT